MIHTKHIACITAHWQWADATSKVPSLLNKGKLLVTIKLFDVYTHTEANTCEWIYDVKINVSYVSLLFYNAVYNYRLITDYETCKAGRTS